MGQGISFKAKGKTSAEILIYEDVGEGWFGGISAKTFADNLKGLGDVKTIDVRINSYGGDVFDGLAIYNQLVQHKATITTHIDGVAASIASVIAMAGKEIRIAESGWLMIHDAWGMAVGNAAVLRDLAGRLDAVSQQLAGVYAARTGRDQDEIRSWMAEEKWFSAGDALDAGMATAMSENMRAAAYAGDLGKHTFMHLPERLSAAAVAQRAAAQPLDDDGRTLRSKVASLALHLQQRRADRAAQSRGAG